MIARDVMTAPVITVHGDATVKEVAGLLLNRHISAVVVTNRNGVIAGILSESDLIRRFESSTERRKRCWLDWIDGHESAIDYTKSHGRKASDVMTRNVITATPETPLHEIANLMERNDIKRVPIVRDGQLVGIVTRANLIQAVATYARPLEIKVEDSWIRERLLADLDAKRWAHTGLLNVTVNGGVVDLWGVTNSTEEKQAIRVAAENVEGVVAVSNNLLVYPPRSGT